MKIHGQIVASYLKTAAVCLQAADGPVNQIRKTAVTPAVPVLQSMASGPAYQRRINTCKAELQQLVQQKREQCSAERMAKQMMESAEWESRPPPPGNALHPAATHAPDGRRGAHRAAIVCFRVASKRSAGRPPARTQSCCEPHQSLGRTLHLRYGVKRRFCESLGQSEDGGQDHDHQVSRSGGSQAALIHVFPLY